MCLAEHRPWFWDIHEALLQEAAVTFDPYPERKRFFEFVQISRDRVRIIGEES